MEYDFSTLFTIMHSVLCTCVWNTKRVIGLCINCPALPSCVIPVYQALSLEQLTAQEFIAKLTEKAGLEQGEVSSVIQLTNSGILVLVDDTV